MQPRVRKIGNKRFALVGSGLTARVFRVEGLGESRKKGTIIRALKRRGKGIEGISKRRVERYKVNRLEKRFVAQQIANILFPENIPKPTGINVAKLRIRYEYRRPDKPLEEYFEIKKQAGVLNERINLLLKHGSNEAAEPLIQKFDELNTRLLDITMQRDSVISGQVVAKKLEEIKLCGFDVDFLSHSNFGLRNPDKPVFYEVQDVKPSVLRKVLSSMNLSNRKKQRIENLLNAYESKGDYLQEHLSELEKEGKNG